MLVIPKLGAKLAGFYFKSESKMTKKDSIFKDLGSYFRSHPITTLGWIWVSFVPLLGSLLLSTRYQELEQIAVTGVGEQVLLILILRLLAVLCTSLLLNASAAA
jgi:hypothetical protein